MENNDSFEFTYSAPEQEEIKKIREKYLPREDREIKMDRLRRLDASVTQKGSMASILLGVIGCLVMGGGMSLCMVGPQAYFAVGIVIGVIGMVGIALAYPVYSRVTARERERIAPEILKLSEELME